MTSNNFASLTRRGFLLGSGAVLLGGCAPKSSLRMAKDTIAAAFPGDQPYPRSREQVEALPYAQIGVRIGSGGRGIMVLNQQVGPDLYWLSANRLLLVTRQGRIVRTGGLPEDLGSTRVYEQDFLQLYDPAKPMIDGLETTMSVDAGKRYGIELRSRYTVEATETITILGQSMETLRVRETIRCAAWDWSATNTHWLSRQSPLIWRSVQHLLPDNPPITIEVLKRYEPPAGTS